MYILFNDLPLSGLAEADPPILTNATNIHFSSLFMTQLGGLPTVSFEPAMYNKAGQIGIHGVCCISETPGATAIYNSDISTTLHCILHVLMPNTIPIENFYHISLDNID